MTWPLFTVIQMSVVTLGVAVAFLLRNRELKKRYRELEKVNAKAFEAINQAKEQIELAATKISIKDRLECLTGDDQITVVQRLVLENEAEPSTAFHGKLRVELNTAEDFEKTLRTQWEKARATGHELAVEMIEDFPLSHPMMVLLYDAFADIDVALSMQPPALPEVPRSVSAEETNQELGTDALPEETADSDEMAQPEDSDEPKGLAEVEPSANEEIADPEQPHPIDEDDAA